jgi:hypothetical protein
MRTLLLFFINSYLRKWVLFSFFYLSLGASFAQNKTLQTFPLSAVRLLESPFKKAQETDRIYMLELDADRLLAPFLKEAGISSKGQGYGNWEGTGLNGHIGGHYLSALSEMYAATGNIAVNDRLVYMLNQLEKCQQANGNGYIGGIPGGKQLWKNIEKGKINAGNFSLNDKWVPWYNIHKLYAGLIDAYTLTGNLKARSMVIKLADWCLKLTANLSDEQIQEMLRSEHGGMNEVFADISAITGDKKYLDLAIKFSDKSILNSLIKNTDALNGMHANTQIPKVIGFMRVAEVAGKKDWANAASFFWNTVVNNRTISIGGNSVREHFNPTNDFSSMIESREGPETCNSYNMLKLSKHLFLADAVAKYMDYYERTTYNHILSSQHPKGGFVYFTPIRPQHYRVYSQPQTSFWCCVGSGLENHGKYGELIYAHNETDLYVNLFIPSTLKWKAKGLSLIQTTKFPYEERSTLKLTLSKAQKLALKIRYPEWVEPGKMKVSVNSKEVTIIKDAQGYVSINQVWRSGDVITIDLPMHTKSEKLPDNSDWVSFVHGPIVLAAATDKTDLIGLKADDSRMGHIANGKILALDEAPLLVSNTDLARSIKPVKNQTLAFSAADIIYQPKFKSLKLVPFYTIHDARYMLYWPFTAQTNLPDLLKSRREKETARLRLDSLTVDVITTGEQQPESDHNFKGEKTETGMYHERHFRQGSGYFQYDLKNGNQQGRQLRITYFGGDRGRNFEIYLNEVLLTTINMDGSDGDIFVDKVYPIPDDFKTTGTPLRIKFKAKEGSSITGIYEIRLLK